MASEVDICNVALQKLAANRITSLTTPDNYEAELCALHYPLVRDCVLEEHAWSFALKRFTLNPTGNEPEWGGDVEYQLPAGVLTVLRLYSDPNAKGPLAPEQWRREGDYVYSTSGAAYALCVVRITDPTRYPALFRAMVSCRLALELSHTVTENADLQAQLSREYAYKVREAAAADGIQARREKVQARRLTGARVY